MTTTPRKPRITFPENPYDGQQVTEEIDEWSVVIWTYDYATNTWSYKVYGAENTNVVVKSEDVVLSRPQTSKLKETNPQIIDGGIGSLRQHQANEVFINNDTDLQKQVLDERMERVERDLELHHRIDGLGEYDETQLREDFAKDQERQDDELLVDQQRQDKELADYKVLVAKEQSDQDQALSDYKTQIAKEQSDQDKALKAEQDARADADAAHDAQLSTIEYKLDALVGLQFKGLYTFKHEVDCDAAYAACLEKCDPTADGHDCRQDCGREMLICENTKVSAGTFEAVDPDDRFDHLQAIVIHKSAINGEELEWDSILKAGDYLEVDHRTPGGLDKQNYGLYRLTADPIEATNNAGEPVFDILLEFLQGEGVLVEDETFEIRGITASEGVNPEELGDFLQKEEAAQTYALKDHNHDSDYITKEADNSTYKDWLLLADGSKKNPTHYAGASHTHGWTEITGKPATYEPAPHSHSNYASSNHTHSGYASSSHTHSGYASSSHNHNSSYVKGNYTISKDSYGNYYIQ